MKITFNLSNNDLKQTALMIYKKKRYYKPIKILLTLIFSLFILFTVVISFVDLIMILALSVIFQTSSLRVLLLLFVIFLLLFSFFYFFFIDFLIKLIIHGKYFLRRNGSLQTTIMIEEEALIYLNNKNRRAIPWREINDILEHKTLYQLYVPYLHQYFPIKKQPETLDENETEQFEKEIHRRISK